MLAHWPSGILSGYRIHWKTFPGETMTTSCNMLPNQVKRVAGLKLGYPWNFLLGNNGWLVTFKPLATFFTWGVLTKLNFFDPMQIKFCSMHSLNLGVSTWVAAGALIVLKEDLQLWGGNDKDPAECFYDAWMDFKNWTKRKKIQQFDCT